ncbi:hypothetical protein GALL_392100 [mine drainage metagenome]|uniref:Uncharacterized protein n=1 Tax=mine drainage metagenome TaxID=410659 RepID=A0A1J5QGD3_9ZZZZ
MGIGDGDAFVRLRENAGGEQQLVFGLPAVGDVVKPADEGLRPLVLDRQVGSQDPFFRLAGNGDFYQPVVHRPALCEFMQDFFVVVRIGVIGLGVDAEAMAGLRHDEFVVFRVGKNDFSAAVGRDSDGNRAGFEQEPQAFFTLLHFPGAFFYQAPHLRGLAGDGQ